MKYTQCPGLEDKKWSQITFGCWQIAPSGGWGDVCSASEADTVIKTALDQNITAFDTAEGYGDGESERRLGKALGDKKHEAIIISKIWPDAELSPASYAKQLEASLKALDRDNVDLYLIHWPGSYFDNEEKSARLCEAMLALKKSGKARLIGLSNFHEQNIRLLGDSLSEFSVNEVPYSLLEREYEGETRKLCAQSKIPYMAFSPTAQGLLVGRTDAEARNFPTRKNNLLYQEPLYSKSFSVVNTANEIAEEIGGKVVNVVLAWVLAQENILTAIVGSRKPEQIIEFSGATEIQLSQEQFARLTLASDSFHQEKSNA
jgi:aryl-alcohol dehydrogenase-like predicted oxidoreductase